MSAEIFTRPATPIGSQNTKGSSVTLLERHYGVQELASAWRLGQNTVRRMFENELGVLRVGKSFRRGGRGYVTLRIPESVAMRVHGSGLR